MINIDLILVQGYNQNATYKQIKQAESLIYPTIELVCYYLNNWFIPQTFNGCRHCGVQRPTTNIESSVISPVSDYQVGDLIRIDGIRNRLVSYITEVNAGTVTVDNINIVNAKEPTKIDLMILPMALQIAIAQMINFNVFVRKNFEAGKLKSETIGSYSYTIDDSVKRVGTLDYPASIANAIEIYKKIKVW